VERPTAFAYGSFAFVVGECAVCIFTRDILPQSRAAGPAFN
jgi:hypothetical protein